MFALSPWTRLLNRLDRLRAGSAIAIGLAGGGLAGAWLAVSPHPAALAAFVAVLAAATALAWTAAPVVDEGSGRAAREPAPGQEWTNPADGSVLVYVPGGEYVLGADDLEEWLLQDLTEDQAKKWASYSKPTHRVRLTGFWIGKFAVTRAQYRRFLEASQDQPEPRYWADERFSGDDQPVVGVSWDEARAYCRWAGLELPSEARWEAAARGSDSRRYPWGDEPPTPERADFGKDFSTERPSAVGAHRSGAGPYGTLGQAGGVWEWCLDVWDPRAYVERDGETDPAGSEGDQGVRVLRGGSWINPATDLASAFRIRVGSSDRYPDVGFRCVLSLPSEP